MSHPHFSAVILVGGFSTRMGSDKALLTRNGERLLDRQQRIALEAGATETWVAGRAGQNYGAPHFLPDTNGQIGPLGGIISALEACRTDLLLVLAVDLAWMEPRWLRQSVGEKGAIPYIDNQPEPLAATYPKLSLPLAKRLVSEGRLAARAFADACCTDGFCQKLVVDRPEDRLYFRNWNTPEDSPLD